MSWSEKNALRRVFNVFKRNKSVYSEDVEALKVLVASIEERKDNAVKSNILFAKLLVIQLRQNLLHYNDFEVALKVTLQDIKAPVEMNLQLLHKDLQNIELFKYSKSIGIKDYKNEKELLENNALISEKQKEIIAKIKELTTYEVVVDNFYNTANEIIKDMFYYG